MPQVHSEPDFTAAKYAVHVQLVEYFMSDISHRKIIGLKQEKMDL